MVCQECNHEWDGELSTCPECGFLPREKITVPTTETSGLKLKIKMRGQQVGQTPPETQLTPSIPILDVPPKTVLDATEPPVSPVVSPSETRQETPVTPVLPNSPVKSYNLVNFTPESGVLPPPIPPRTRKSHWRGILLASLAACLALILGLTMSSRVFSPPEPQQALQHDDAVSLNLANFSGQPLIVRIGNRVIALDDGQTMSKTVSKGIHDVSWRFTEQDSSFASSLSKENVSTDANWRFVLEAKESDQTVIRTVETAL